MSGRRPRRRAPVALGLAVVLGAAPAAIAAPTAPAEQAPTAPGPVPAPADPAAVRAAALDAAAGWRDTLDDHRAPQLPTPGDTESVILILADPPAADAPPEGRRGRRPGDHVRPGRPRPGAGEPGRDGHLPLADPRERRRRARAGGTARVARGAPRGALGGPGGLPRAGPGRRRAARPSPAPAGPRPPPRPAAGGSPAHIALIDAGIDASHPWLGGGIGPTFPIIGGVRPDRPRSRPERESRGPGRPRPTAPRWRASCCAPRPWPVSRPRGRRACWPTGSWPARPSAAACGRSPAPTACWPRSTGRSTPTRTATRRTARDVILMGLTAGFDGGGVDPVARALEAADRVGATVVVPAGNDGPTFARPGSVGGPGGDADGDRGRGPVGAGWRRARPTSRRSARAGRGAAGPAAADGQGARRRRGCRSCCCGRRTGS